MGQELLRALAGPVVNAAIAFLLIVTFGSEVATGSVSDQKIGYATRLALANVMLVLFNLIAAFTMDGGCVLWAVLTLHLNRATQLSARVGHAIAFGLGSIGLFGSVGGEVQRG